MTPLSAKLMLAACLLLMVSGCELMDPRKKMREALTYTGPSPGPDPTAAIRKEHYHTWPKDVQKSVDDRLVFKGMDKNQVLVSLRIKEAMIRKSVYKTPNGERERWIVWRMMNGWAYTDLPNSKMVAILFENGIVVGVYH